MAAYRVTIQMVYELTAATKKEAESKVSERIHAPEDDPPGRLTNYKVTAREMGT